MGIIALLIIIFLHLSTIVLTSPSSQHRNSVRHPISRPLPLPLPRRPDADQKPVPRKPNKPPRHQPKYHLPRSEIKQILKAHNEARAHESEPLYVWDESLALYARQWADKRINDCRIVHSNGPYGENIFLAAKDHWSIPKAVKSWVNEEKYYDKESNVCQPGKMCGHYTQIVWRDTMKVGCARVKCEMGGVFIMCSYDPPGNYQDENPFASHEQ